MIVQFHVMITSFRQLTKIMNAYFIFFNI